MIYLWLLEAVLVAGLVGLLMRYSALIENRFKTLETKLHGIAQEHTFESLSKIHLALGYNKTDFEGWWNKHWLITKIIAFVFCLFALLTQKFIWLFAPVLFIGFKIYSLIKARRIRKEKILKRIPFVLDMVILNLKSGLDFVSSLEELIEMNDQHPLLDEIRHTLQSIHLGETRSLAFRSLGERTQVTELSNLASVIEQSETMGTSLVELLTMQSEEIRHRIFKLAESEAQKAPVKILIPMLLCIFPVVFIILFVPIGIQVLEVFK